MKQAICYILFLAFILGCEDSEIVEINESNKGARTLIINWENTPSEYEKMRLYLYNNYTEYNKPYGKYIYCDSIINNNSFTIDQPDLADYYVKIFGINKNDVHYYQNSSSKLNYPIVNNTYSTYTFNIQTNIVELMSCRLIKMEIYDIPSHVNNKIGEEVELKIMLENDSTKDKIVNTKIGTIEQRSVFDLSQYLSYEPYFFINLSQTEKKYYLTINDKKYCKINIIELLYSQAFFDDVLIKLNKQNEIEFKIFVNWDY